MIKLLLVSTVTAGLLASASLAAESSGVFVGAQIGAGGSTFKSKVNDGTALSGTTSVSATGFSFGIVAGISNFLTIALAYAIMPILTTRMHRLKLKVKR